uniref:Uncharacterized protein n=1 Tax=viral metagenome TaxID=1070528 RepID=A0A6C0ADH7_9ZZZZ
MNYLMSKDLIIIYSLYFLNHKEPECSPNLSKTEYYNFK